MIQLLVLRRTRSLISAQGSSEARTLGIIFTRRTPTGLIPFHYYLPRVVAALRDFLVLKVVLNSAAAAASGSEFRTWLRRLLRHLRMNSEVPCKRDASRNIPRPRTCNLTFHW